MKVPSVEEGSSSSSSLQGLSSDQDVNSQEIKEKGDLVHAVVESSEESKAGEGRVRLAALAPAVNEEPPIIGKFPIAAPVERMARKQVEGRGVAEGNSKKSPFFS